MQINGVGYGTAFRRPEPLLCVTEYLRSGCISSNRRLQLPPPVLLRSIRCKLSFRRTRAHPVRRQETLAAISRASSILSPRLRLIQRTTRCANRFCPRQGRSPEMFRMQRQVSLRSKPLLTRRLRVIPSQVNSLTSAIAQLNTQIQASSPNTDAGTLEDQRQQDLSQLSQLIGTNQITTENNGISLTTSSGETSSPKAPVTPSRPARLTGLLISSSAPATSHRRSWPAEGNWAVSLRRVIRTFRRPSLRSISLRTAFLHR